MSGEKLSDVKWKHRYIPTPITRTVRIKDDLTAGNFLTNLCQVDNIGGYHIRYEITAWQDETEGIKKDAIERTLLDAGAISVDIRITRVPRANIRAEAVLKAETLADKLTKRAELSGETIDPGVLELAGILEGTAAERVLEMVMGGEL